MQTINSNNAITSKGGKIWEIKKKYPCLKVTSVFIHTINDDREFIRGVASIILNNQLLLQRVYITKGLNGSCVLFELKSYGMEHYCFGYVPLTNKLRNHIETSVLKAYKKALKKKKRCV